MMAFKSHSTINPSGIWFADLLYLLMPVVLWYQVQIIEQKTVKGLFGPFRWEALIPTFQQRALLTAFMAKKFYNNRKRGQTLLKAETPAALK
ncbi:hypothetical protein ACLOJK_010985 [Asimina triloba]